MELYQMFQISKIIPHCYSTVSNMRQYEQQWQNEILLFYCVFFFPLPQISLSLSTLSYFFSLCHSLSLTSPPCSRSLLRKLPLISSVLAHRSHRLMILSPHALALVDLASFRFVIGFWFGLMFLEIQNDCIVFPNQRICMCAFI